VLLVVVAVWLGAETTCALLYLLMERALRPVTALALAARVPRRPVAPGIRGRLLMTWSLGTGVPILGVLAVGSSARRRPTSTSSTSPPPASSSASSRSRSA
jgi:adenylate cyclase